MSQVANAYPPMDAGVEIETVTFDFGNTIPPGISLSSILSVTISVVGNSQLDPSASTRLIGPAYIVNAPPPPIGTGVVRGAVVQQIGNLVGGVEYILQCVAVTPDGQQKSLFMHVPCITPR